MSTILEALRKLNEAKDTTVSSLGLKVGDKIKLKEFGDYGRYGNYSAKTLTRWVKEIVDDNTIVVNNKESLDGPFTKTVKLDSSKVMGIQTVNEDLTNKSILEKTFKDKGLTLVFKGKGTEDTYYDIFGSYPENDSDEPLHNPRVYEIQNTDFYLWVETNLLVLVDSYGEAYNYENPTEKDIDDIVGIIRKFEKSQMDYDGENSNESLKESIIDGVDDDVVNLYKEDGMYWGAGEIIYTKAKTLKELIDDIEAEAQDYDMEFYVGVDVDKSNVDWEEKNPEDLGKVIVTWEPWRPDEEEDDGLYNGLPLEEFVLKLHTPEEWKAMVKDVSTEKAATWQLAQIIDKEVFLKTGDMCDIEEAKKIAKKIFN